MVHPYNNEGAIARLWAEYKKYDTLYIAFDFDNTLWNWDMSKGYSNDSQIFIHHKIANILRKAKEHGMKLILWTSCAKKEDEIVKHDICKKYGVEPDYVNWSPLSPEAVKPHFNLLLDDRAGLESAYDTLKEIIKRIEDENTEDNTEEA